MWSARTMSISWSKVKSAAAERLEKRPTAAREKTNSMNPVSISPSVTVEARMTRILGGPLLPLVFVFSAAALWPSRPAAGTTLKLPLDALSLRDRRAAGAFPRIRANPATRRDNPLTDEGAAGRMLFS